MELKQLEAFVAVVELKSFSAAAKKLFLTQPTVSSHIATLEKVLKTRLILRTTKSLSLSKQGEKLYSYAKDMLTIRDSILSEFGDENREQVIRIAASTVPSQYILPNILSAFKKEHPKVSFNLLSGDSDMVLSNIESGNADFGLVGSTTNSANFNFLPFSEDKLVIITQNNDDFPDIGTLSLEEIFKHPFISRENGSGTRKEFEKYLTSQGKSSEDLNIVATIDSIDGIKNAVVSGLGIAVLPLIAAENFHKLGLLKVFSLDNAPIQRELFIVRMKSKPLSSIAIKLIKEIRKFGN